MIIPGSKNDDLIVSILIKKNTVNIPVTANIFIFVRTIVEVV
jgi:hypothetical protein